MPRITLLGPAPEHRHTSPRPAVNLVTVTHDNGVGRPGTTGDRRPHSRSRVPGVEARAGKFPGPSLIPALNAIQSRLGWLPREELVALGRETHRPLYEIEGLV